MSTLQETGQLFKSKIKGNNEQVRFHQKEAGAGGRGAVENGRAEGGGHSTAPPGDVPLTFSKPVFKPVKWRNSSYFRRLRVFHKITQNITESGTIKRQFPPLRPLQGAPAIVPLPVPMASL